MAPRFAPLDPGFGSARRRSRPAWAGHRRHQNQRPDSPPSREETPGWPAGLRRAGRAGLIVCFSGALSSDQRVFLIQRPVGVWERSWAFHSSRRTWSVARLASRHTWNGGQTRSRRRGPVRGSPSHSRPTCRSRPGPDRVLAVAELGEEALQRGVVAAGRAPHDRARLMVDDRGQVALMAAVADFSSTPMATRPASRVSSKWSATTRSTIRPTVTQPILTVRRSAWRPSAGPTRQRRPQRRACSARPRAPTGPPRAGRRSHGTEGVAARTR